MKILTASVLSLGLVLAMSTSTFAFGGCSGKHAKQTVAMDQNQPAHSQATVATAPNKTGELKDLLATVTKKDKTTEVAQAPAKK